MNKQIYGVYYVQCISADFNWFERFYMRNTLVKKYGECFVNRWDAFAEHGTCLLEKDVYNLIIKRDIGYKTTYDVFRYAVHVMAEMIKKLANDFPPLKGSDDGKLKWKFFSMDANQLRIEVEDKLSQIEDIEQLYDQSKTTPEEEEAMVKEYRLLSLTMSLAARELFNRDFKMKDIEIF